MKTEYTFVYSSGSVESLENLISTMSVAFNLHVTIDDLFYYGVFCQPEIYAYYKHWDEAPDDLEIPSVLTNSIQRSNSKLDYVKGIINNILTGEIEKPEWMVYVEMEETGDYYDHAPSTYLYLSEKNETYKDLADALFDFLYSANTCTITINKE